MTLGDKEQRENPVVAKNADIIYDDTISECFKFFALKIRQQNPQRLSG